MKSIDLSLSTIQAKALCFVLSKPPKRALPKTLQEILETAERLTTGYRLGLHLDEFEVRYILSLASAWAKTPTDLAPDIAEMSRSLMTELRAHGFETSYGVLWGYLSLPAGEHSTLYGILLRIDISVRTPFISGLLERLRVSVVGHPFKYLIQEEELHTLINFASKVEPGGDFLSEEKICALLKTLRKDCHQFKKDDMKTQITFTAQEQSAAIAILARDTNLGTNLRYDMLDMFINNKRDFDQTYVFSADNLKSLASTVNNAYSAAIPIQPSGHVDALMRKLRDFNLPLVEELPPLTFFRTPDYEGDSVYLTIGHNDPKTTARTVVKLPEGVYRKVSNGTRVTPSRITSMEAAK